MSIDNNHRIFADLDNLMAGDVRNRIERLAHDLYGGDDGVDEKHQETFWLLVDVMNVMLLDYMDGGDESWYSAYVTALQGLEENMDIRLTDANIDFRGTMRRNDEPASPFKFTVWYKPEEAAGGEPWLIVNENDDSFSFWPSLDEALLAIREEATSEQLGENDDETV